MTRLPSQRRGFDNQSLPGVTEGLGNLIPMHKEWGIWTIALISCDRQKPCSTNVFVADWLFSKGLVHSVLPVFIVLDANYLLYFLSFCLTTKGYFIHVGVKLELLYVQILAALCCPLKLKPVWGCVRATRPLHDEVPGIWFTSCFSFF